MILGWVLKKDVFEFPKEIRKEETVPSEELVQTAVSYARALEIIIWDLLNVEIIVWDLLNVNVCNWTIYDSLICMIRDHVASFAFGFAQQKHFKLGAW